MMHGRDWDTLGRLSEAERRDGPIPEDELILIRYGSFAAFEASRAKAQVRHFAGLSRRAIRGLRLRRALRHDGRYDHVDSMTFAQLIDSDIADIRFYLRERRKWLRHLLKIDRSGSRGGDPTAARVIPGKIGLTRPGRR